MWLLYCIFGIHFCLFTSADNQLGPAITHITRDMIKNVGDSVELLCNVDDAHLGELSWVRTNFKHEDSILIFIGITMLTNEWDHYYVDYNEANSTYTLMIRDLKEEDAGIYKCRRIKLDFRSRLQQDMSIQAETNLQVIKPPITLEKSSGQSGPVITYITHNTEKNVGESIELTCSVQNVLPGELSWVRENFEREHSVLISKGNIVLADDILHYNVRYKAANSAYTLKIRVLQAEDAGIYKCKIIKPGYSISAETKLQVIKRPVIAENTSSQSGPVITYISQSMTKKVGETVELECSIENAHPDEFAWVKTFPEYVETSIFANNEDHYSVKYNAANSSNTLKIRDLKEKDAGIYKCVIVKSNFNVEAGIKLQVIKGPVTSKNSSNPSGPVRIYSGRNMIKTVGESAELVCGVQNAQPDQVAWVKVSAGKKFRNILIFRTSVFAEYPHHYNIRYNAANSSYIITIRDLQEEDAGVYLCEIVISHARSEGGTVLEVNKRPVIAENPSSTGSVSAVLLD